MVRKIQPVQPNPECVTACCKTLEYNQQQVDTNGAYNMQGVTEDEKTRIDGSLASRTCGGLVLSQDVMVCPSSLVVNYAALTA